MRDWAYGDFLGLKQRRRVKRSFLFLFRLEGFELTMLFSSYAEGYNQFANTKQRDAFLYSSQGSFTVMSSSLLGELLPPTSTFPHVLINFDRQQLRSKLNKLILKLVLLSSALGSRFFPTAAGSVIPHRLMVVHPHRQLQSRPMVCTISLGPFLSFPFTKIVFPSVFR